MTKIIYQWFDGNCYHGRTENIELLVDNIGIVHDPGDDQGLVHVAVVAAHVPVAVHTSVDAEGSTWKSEGEHSGFGIDSTFK